jgi:hypothetical protein
MEWIDLTGDRERWLVLVNVVMDFRAPYSAVNVLTG